MGNSSTIVNVASVPPPGFFIREELEARSLSQRDLAYILGCPEQVVNMIVSGKRGISPEMAKALGDAFDVPAEFFANLQNAYDLAKARDPTEREAKGQVAESLPGSRDDQAWLAGRYGRDLARSSNGEVFRRGRP